MARGWESKDVESQAEQRAEAREASRAAAAAEKLTAEQAVSARRREALELDRTRIQREIAATTHPRRKEQLEAALHHLDTELAKLARD